MNQFNGNIRTLIPPKMERCWREKVERMDDEGDEGQSSCCYHTLKYSVGNTAPTVHWISLADIEYPQCTASFIRVRGLFWQQVKSYVKRLTFDPCLRLIRLIDIEGSS